MWERIWQAGRAAWALIGVTAAIAVVGFVIWQFRAVFPHVVLAGAIVFILNPVVTVLSNRGLPRIGGTALTYLGVIGIIVASGFLIAPLVGTQANELSEQWPELRSEIEADIDDWSERSQEGNWVVEIPDVDEIRDQLGGTDDAFLDEFDTVVDEASSELEANNDDVIAADLDRIAADTRGRLPMEGGLTEQLNTVREIGTRIFEIGLIFLLAPIIAFYLLVDLPHIRDVATGLVPAAATDQTIVLAHRLNHAIGGYFRGQLAVAFIVGTLVSIGLGILGLPFWLLVGMITGLFNMIPLIGPWVGGIPGVVIALTTRDFGTAVWVVAIMVGVQQVDNHFISPLVMQRTTRLHPAVVMVALLAGGLLGGFFGLLLAVPVTAALKVVLGHFWRIYVLEQSLDEVIAVHEPDSGAADLPYETIESRP